MDSEPENNKEDNNSAPENVEQDVDDLEPVEPDDRVEREREKIEPEEKMGSFKRLYERWKLYSKISELGLVARRFFVKNMTDGILTTLGVVIGFYVLYLSDPTQIQSSMIIILPGIGTAVAMCVSGVLASFLTETAERRKALLELRQEMVLVEQDEPSQKKNKKKTLKERAEKFATIVASLIDGFSPFFAALVVLIPFYFPLPLSHAQFIISIVLTCVLLFMLGTFLAHLSKMNLVVYGLKMVAMGLLTLVITYLLGQF